MQYYLYINNERSTLKNVGVGELHVALEGKASFHRKGSWYYLDRTKLDFISLDAMRLSGFAKVGINTDGTIKYDYREWVLHGASQENP